MIDLVFQGQIPLFFLIIIALVLSLSFHEFGHAAMARLFGDDTAQRMGRLTLNPLAHLDPMGLMMVVFLGFGWAKPVPTNPNNFTSRWADFWVSAAGPLMNLVLAFVVINGWVWGIAMGFENLRAPGPYMFFLYLARINLLLMLFNLIPLGALDGHYILPYFLTPRAAASYREFNARYGNMALMSLLLLSFVGIPVFHYLSQLSGALLPWLVVL